MRLKISAIDTDFKGIASSKLGGLNGQTFASFRPPPVYYPPTALGRHAGTKPVFVASLPVARLKGPFHLSLSPDYSKGWLNEDSI